jgi:hypothetical protein
MHSFTSISRSMTLTRNWAIHIIPLNSRCRYVGTLEHDGEISNAMTSTQDFMQMGQFVSAVLFCVVNCIRGPEDGTISEKLTGR